MFQVGKYVMMTPSKGLLCIQLIVCPEAAARLRLGDDRRRRGCDGRPRLPRTAGRGGRGGPPSTWCHDDGRDWRRDLPGPLVSNEGNYRIVQIEIFSKGLITRTLSKRSNKISRRLCSRRRQIVMMSYIIANWNVAQNNDTGIRSGGFNWRMLSTRLLTAALCQHKH